MNSTAKIRIAYTNFHLSGVRVKLIQDINSTKGDIIIIMYSVMLFLHIGAYSPLQSKEQNTVKTNFRKDTYTGTRTHAHTRTHTHKHTHTAYIRRKSIG